MNELTTSELSLPYIEDLTMSAPILLNLLNKLGKGIKLEACRA